MRLASPKPSLVGRGHPLPIPHSNILGVILLIRPWLWRTVLSIEALSARGIVVTDVVVAVVVAAAVVELQTL